MEKAIQDMTISQLREVYSMLNLHPQQEASTRNDLIATLRSHGMPASSIYMVTKDPSDVPLQAGVTTTTTAQQVTKPRVAARKQAAFQPKHVSKILPPIDIQHPTATSASYQNPIRSAVKSCWISSGTRSTALSVSSTPDSKSSTSSTQSNESKSPRSKKIPTVPLQQPPNRGTIAKGLRHNHPVTVPTQHLMLPAHGPKSASYSGKVTKTVKNPSATKSVASTGSKTSTLPLIETQSSSSSQSGTTSVAPMKQSGSQLPSLKHSQSLISNVPSDFPAELTFKATSAPNVRMAKTTTTMKTLPSSAFSSITKLNGLPSDKSSKTLPTQQQVCAAPRFLTVPQPLTVFKELKSINERPFTVSKELKRIGDKTTIPIVANKQAKGSTKQILQQSDTTNQADNDEGLMTLHLSSIKAPLQKKSAVNKLTKSAIQTQTEEALNLSSKDQQATPQNSSAKTKTPTSDESVQSGPELIKSQSSAEILQQNRNLLTPYEQTEILNYAKIFCTGAEIGKKIDAPPDWKEGEPYDDGDGFYKVILTDHIAYRYEVIRQIGRGTFSHVVKAHDRQTDTFVAIKISRKGPSFEFLVEREIKILKHLRKGDPTGHSNVVRLLDDFTFRGHICMVFELLYCDLYRVIGATATQGLSMTVVKKFAVHMLHCLEYLRINGVVHGDLKPENVMLKQQKRTAVKVLDFGWSWFIDSDRCLGNYIQSRYYRAPEVTLGGPFTSAIDIWSFACMVAELACGVPLFIGEDKYDQLTVIMEVLGLPPASLVMKWKKGQHYFSKFMEPFYCKKVYDSKTGIITLTGGLTEKTKTYRGVPGSKSMETALEGCTDPLLIDFLGRCLMWDPKDRLTPSAALRHVFLRETREEVEKQKKTALEATGGT